MAMNSKQFIDGYAVSKMDDDLDRTDPKRSKAILTCVVCGDHAFGTKILKVLS